jgi:hypothetical protein
MPRPPSHRSNDRPQQGRRKPPQTDTDEERRFLHGQLRAGERLAVQLTDGTRTVGVIRKYTEDTIELETDDRPGVLLQKSQIRYIEET